MLVIVFQSGSDVRIQVWVDAFGVAMKVNPDARMWISSRCEYYTDFFFAKETTTTKQAANGWEGMKAEVWNNRVGQLWREKNPLNSRDS